MQTESSGGDPVREEMKCAEPPSDASRRCVYRATVPTTRPARDYTVRVIPQRSRCGGSVGIRSNPMATMMNTPQRDLQDYISEISERADVRAGSPLAIGNSGNGRRGEFRHFQPLRQPRSTGVVRPSRRRSARPGHRSGFSAQPHRRRLARLGEGDRSRSTLCLPRGWPLRTQRRTSFQFQQASPRSLRYRDFAAAPVGFCIGTWIRPVAPEQDLALSKLDNSSSMPKCVFVNEPFEWDGDQALRHPWSKTVIYETHVRGFTIHPKSGVDHPGTYRGLMEKIPYLTNPGSDRRGTDARAGVQ